MTKPSHPITPIVELAFEASDNEPIGIWILPNPPFDNSMIFKVAGGLKMTQETWNQFASTITDLREPDDDQA